MACKGVCGKSCVVCPVVLAFVLQRCVNLPEELRSVLTPIDGAVAWNTNKSYVPHFHFQQLETCNKDNLHSRVCVVRKAIDSNTLEEFVRMNEYSELSFVGEVSDVPDTGSLFRKAASKQVKDKGAAVIATVPELLRGEVPHTYKMFGSFNYSQYGGILARVKEQGLFEGHDMPDRADIFAGHTSTTMSTAGFHGNQLEMSTTVQVFGEKLWNFITPQCWLHEMTGYHIGAGFLAFAELSMEALERCTITSTIAGPGDVIVFAKGWPHQTYTLPGPNFMINLRTDAFDLFRPTDLITMAFALMSKLVTEEQKPISCNPDAELAPTAFFQGSPNPNTTFGKIKKKRSLNDRIDLRHCRFVNQKISSYFRAQAKLAPTKEVEANIMQQLGAFHGRDFV